MLGELHRRFPGHGDERAEQIIGVLVLMCVTKPDNNGQANINHILADVPFRLTPIQ
jgi:hypothetical protein